MELLRDNLSRITGSMHCLGIKGEYRRAACSTAVYSVPTSAAAEADSSAFFTKFFRELNKLSERMGRLEESLQREGRWPRRRRRRGNLRCHRCQQPGHIARHCRAPAPIPAGRRQPSVAANPAPEIDARDSAVPTAAIERDERSNEVDRESVSGRQLRAAHRRPLPYLMPHNMSHLLVCLMEELEKLTCRLQSLGTPLGTPGGILCRATQEQCVTTVDEAPLPRARRRPSLGHQPPRLVRRPVGSGPGI